MRTSAGFHRDNTGLHLAEEGQLLIPPQRLARHRPAGAVSSVHLKHIP
jgi:hypothetical protein